jgi:hypothetical protein
VSPKETSVFPSNESTFEVERFLKAILVELAALEASYRFPLGLFNYIMRLLVEDCCALAEIYGVSNFSILDCPT